MNRFIKSFGRDQSQLARLRRRLFILAGYVLVTLALLLYVTYSAYVRKFDATVVMPEVAKIEALLKLEPGHTYHVAGTDDLFLADLAPGDSVSSFAANTTDTTHKIKLTVQNHAAGTDNADFVSQVPLEYTVRIETNGILPLEFILHDGTTQYTDYYNETDDYYYFVDSSKEKVFTLDSGAQAQQQLSIFVGWDSTADGAEDGALRKEVEVIDVRVDVSNKPTGDNIAENPETLITPPSSDPET